MQLTLHTDYALRVLIYLMNHPGQKVTTREMAEFYGISLNHLTKVAKALTKSGWLKATRGAGGGLVLAAHTPNAKIGEIVRLTESRELVECFDPARNTCPITRSCELKPILYQARRAFYDVLDAHTVRDLAKASVESGGSVRARPKHSVSGVPSRASTAKDKLSHAKRKPK